MRSKVSSQRDVGASHGMTRTDVGLYGKVPGETFLPSTKIQTLLIHPEVSVTMRSNPLPASFTCHLQPSLQPARSTKEIAIKTLPSRGG